MRIEVTLTSDFICPWCYIGEQRLATAIAGLPAEISVDVSYLPFELNPDAPAGGRDRRSYRIAKFGSWEKSQALDARIVAVGQADGLAFNYDRVTRTPSTMPAHRLMWLARSDGADQTKLAESLFVAYFTTGLDISDHAVLRRLATEAGLAPDRITAVLDGDLGTAETRDLISEAYRRGIQGVPLFEIGGMAISGAQPAEILGDALRRAAGLQAAA